MGTVPANAIARKAISAARPRPAEPAARTVAVEDDSDDGSDDRGNYQSGHHEAHSVHERDPCE